MLKVVKKQTCPLQTGDVIYVVYRKNEPEHSKRGPAGWTPACCAVGTSCRSRGALWKESVEAASSCRNVRVSSLLFMEVLGEGSVCSRFGGVDLAV